MGTFNFMKAHKGSMKRVKVGKIPFSVGTFNDAIDSVISIVNNEKHCHQIVVANAYSVVLAQKDKEFQNICEKADIVFADGYPIVIISKLLGKKIPQRIAGPDFMWEFCGICAKKGFKMFLLGSEEPYLSQLKSNLENVFKGVQIVGTYSPPFGIWSEIEENNMIRRVNDSRADILWLGVSTPKQDKWINSVKHRLKVKVAIAVGAAFDFHSGRISRAPLWVQKYGFEWFYRLLQDPGRLWKRYLIGNLTFLKIALLQIIRNIFKGKR
jgi:exopolysaccharide biosynthesis WecB/TagA/CpsF family protein